jgi:hypothetical protein
VFAFSAIHRYAWPDRAALYPVATAGFPPEACSRGKYHAANNVNDNLVGLALAWVATGMKKQATINTV